MYFLTTINMLPEVGCRMRCQHWMRFILLWSIHDEDDTSSCAPRSDPAWLVSNCIFLVAKYITLVLSAALLASGQWVATTFGQQSPAEGPQSSIPPLFLVDRFSWECRPSLSQEGQTATWQPRARLFRFAASILQAPLGLAEDDDALLFEPTLSTVIPTSIGGADRLNVVAGTDNPYFDFRLPDDPGGIGYYRLETQYVILDKGPSSLSLGLRATTPIGLENGGVANGPTTLHVSAGFFQELSGSLAVHGFLGQELPAEPGWARSLNRGMEYGLALQVPIPGLVPAPDRDVSVLLEALGGAHRVPEAQEQTMWGLLPGYHGKLGRIGLFRAASYYQSTNPGIILAPGS